MKGKEYSFKKILIRYETTLHHSLTVTLANPALKSGAKIFLSADRILRGNKSKEIGVLYEHEDPDSL